MATYSAGEELAGSKLTADLTPAAWTVCTMQNSWTTSGSGANQLSAALAPGGRQEVWLRGLCTPPDGTTPANEIVAILPATHWPASTVNVRFLGINTTTGAVVPLAVNTSGELSIYVASYNTTAAFIVMATFPLF